MSKVLLFMSQCATEKMNERRKKIHPFHNDVHFNEKLPLSSRIYVFSYLLCNIRVKSVPNAVASQI